MDFTNLTKWVIIFITFNIFITFLIVFIFKIQNPFKFNTIILTLFNRLNPNCTISGKFLEAKPGIVYKAIILAVVQNKAKQRINMRDKVFIVILNKRSIWWARLWMDLYELKISKTRLWAKNFNFYFYFWYFDSIFISFTRRRKI